MNLASRPSAVVGRATVVDVARAAGVSGRTVSRVVAHDENVSAHTRARVMQAVEELHFRPNRLARQLRAGGRSTTVGFIIGDLSNPFYAEVAAGVESVLAGDGLTMLLAATRDDPALELRRVAAMLEHRVRALLLVPVGENHAYLEHEDRTGTPVVAVDRPALDADLDCVVFDNSGGAAAGVRSLIAHGHRRIGFIGSGQSIYTHEQRLAGYCAALEQAGIGFDVDLIRRDAPDPRSAERATRDLLGGAHPPTALFVANNVAAQGVLPVTQEHRQVDLIVFDDFDYAPMLGISVIAHDPHAMGREAALLALSRLDDPARAPKRITLPTRLIQREASGSGSPRRAARRVVAPKPKRSVATHVAT